MGSITVSNSLPQSQLVIAAGSIGATYSVVGKFTLPIVKMYIISTMDAAVQVSFDGVNDHIAIPAGNTVPVYFPLDFKGNLTVLPDPTIAVKRIGTPTVGSLYICAFSAQTP